MKRQKYTINYLKHIVLSFLFLAGTSHVSGQTTNSKTPGSRPVWDASGVAVIFIDYQPEMFSAVRSGDPKKIEVNARFLARLAKTMNIPTILSTVGVVTKVGMSFNHPTIDSLKADLAGDQEIDRTTMDAYEDAAFLKAVKATGKKRLVIVGLFTEICLTYPVLEFLRDGYEVMFITDAVGGTSVEAHQVAIQRMIQAGAIPNTCAGLSAELFRDWKSPNGKKAGPVLGWYTREMQRLVSQNKYD